MESGNIQPLPACPSGVNPTSMGETMSERRHMGFAPREDYFSALELNGARRWEAWHMEQCDNGWRTIFFKREYVRSPRVLPLEKP